MSVETITLTRFSTVIHSPAGTLARRTSWPAHWYVTIGADGYGESQALHYTCTLDGNGPFGGEYMIGQSVRYSSIPIADAAAEDWTVIDEPPFDILGPGRKVEFAILADGNRVIPVTSIPDSAEGDRVILLIPTRR